jgi:hypothetical protein
MLRTTLTIIVLLLCAPAFADDIAVLSDEFDDATSLRRWQRVYQTEQSGANQLQRFAIDDGRLTMIPHASVWYQDYRGVLAYKRVAGDFIVTTNVSVSGRSGRDAPGAQFSLAGIMIRTPRDVTPRTWRPGGENYVFLSLGAANQPGRYQFEVKTTRDSDSQLEIEDGAPSAEIRAARIGDALILLRRFPGQAWRVHRRYHRPDMPDELQVGMTCYTDWPTCNRMSPAEHNRTVIRGGNPDLIARFDYYRLARPTVPAALAGQNLADPNAVSDADLLSFLGNAAD